MPETGQSRYPDAPISPVVWTAVPTRAGRVGAIGLAHRRRGVVFHELHRMVRWTMDAHSLGEVANSECMATAFERDFAGARAPGNYPPEAAAWVDEIRRLPDSAEHCRWLFRHPDGRRWILLKSGTYLLDRVTRASGRWSADLASTVTSSRATAITRERDIQDYGRWKSAA